jgi:acetoin utilization deacetylase AcuC-like enzyme
MTGLHLDPIYKEHDTGHGHPEQIARYDAVTDALTSAGLVSRTHPIPLRKADEGELALCHHARYIEIVKADVRAGKGDLSTGDTNIGPKSYDVAVAAVGAVLNAVDAVMTGTVPNAFCAVRPPGHHARPAQGMGFCLFNNIAIGARHAQKKHGADKVLIVDWDVHHGNGTQDIFHEDGSVFFFSTHQSPWYPFTGHSDEKGAGKGKGTTMNFPFPAGAGIKEIGKAFGEHLRTAMTDFKPDLVMISAGFDSRMGDPLGHFMLTDDDFTSLTRIMREIADEHCTGRIVSVLEGGYHLKGLASAVTAHVGALLS